ncbi:MAG: hypothetical protein QME40_07880 [bacterium]|nr:hypothetical protein [bacterium]
MNHKDRISIFVITDFPNKACAIIHLLGLLKYLAREYLVELTCFFLDNKHTDVDLNYLENRWRLADIVILQRGISLEEMFLIHEMMDKCRKVFVFEIDNNLMKIPKTHPGFFVILSYKEIIQAIISKSDAITTTTPILAEYLKQLNPSVYVLPNLIDPELFLLSENSKKDKSDRIILGFSGTSHIYLIFILLCQRSRAF